MNVNIQLLIILELIQYTVIFSIVIFFITKFLDIYIFKLREEKEYVTMSTIKILFELIINLIIIIIIYYYILKIRKYIPSIGTYFNKDFVGGRTLNSYIYNIVCVYLYMELIMGTKTKIAVLRERLHKNKYGFL
jgi:hypothetical protein